VFCEEPRIAYDRVHLSLLLPPYRRRALAGT
jgi:NAD(P)H-nitrite reductase large subunit